MLRLRHYLSLVAALSLCTLAAADSIPANTTLPHAAITVGYHPSLTLSESRVAPFSGVFSNHTPTGESRNTVLATVVTSRTMSVGSLSDRNRAPQYQWKNSGHSMATPEPESLLLLSTGLIGISGLLRRRLLRG